MPIGVNKWDLELTKQFYDGGNHEVGIGWLQMQNIKCIILSEWPCAIIPTINTRKHLSTCLFLYIKTKKNPSFHNPIYHGWYKRPLWDNTMIKSYSYNMKLLQSKMLKASLWDGQMIYTILCVYSRQIIEICISSTMREVITIAIYNILLKMLTM